MDEMIGIDNKNYNNNNNNNDNIYISDVNNMSIRNMFHVYIRSHV